MIVEKLWDSLTVRSVDYPLVMENLRQTAREIQRHHAELNDLILYGSFARGDYTPSSDLDLMMILADCREPFLVRSDPFIDYFRIFPFDVNLLVYSKAELTQMQQEQRPFIREVLEQGISLLDG